MSESGFELLRGDFCKNTPYCFYELQPPCDLFNSQTLDMGSKMSFSRASGDQSTVSDLTSVASRPRNSIHVPSDCKQVVSEN